MSAYRPSAHHIGNVVFGTIFTMLIIWTILGRTTTVFQSNLFHKQLLEILSELPEDWIALASSTSSFEGEIKSASREIAVHWRGQQQVEQANECDATESVECSSLSNLVAILALWHNSHRREQLAESFWVVGKISSREDGLAVSKLVSMNASGILLAAGSALNDQDNSSRAVSYLEAAHILQPMDYPVLRQLSILYLSDENFCDLLRVATTGSEQYDSSLFYYYMGRAYEGLGLWSLAAEAYSNALARFPDYEPYIVRLTSAQTYAKQQEPLDPRSFCIP